LLINQENGNNPSGFLTLAGSIESAGKSREGERHANTDFLKEIKNIQNINKIEKKNRSGKPL
jgi:hypothetical protein